MNVVPINNQARYELERNRLRAWYDGQVEWVRATVPPEGQLRALLELSPEYVARKKAVDALRPPGVAYPGVRTAGKLGT